jgi:pimeloyl-ACP methyl ester carboxylesterase
MKVTTTILLFAGAALIGTALWLYTPDASRASLEAAYAKPPSTFLTVDGVRLHLRDTGPRDAPALIMLHGFGSSLHTWEPWAEALSPQHRVIRFDLPGFGLTGPDPTGDYSDTRATKILADLMDALHVSRATIIGNSLGGKIAWQFAAAYPDRVARLVLISPDGYESPGFEYGKKAEVPAVIRVLPYMLKSFLVRMNLVPAYADPARLTDAVVTRYRDMMIAPGVRRAMIARMEQVELQPPEPMLHRIRAPTLLLWGEQDGMIPFANAQNYLKAIPGAKLVAYPDLGHVPFEEAPAEALPPLRAFFSDTPK